MYSKGVAKSNMYVRRLKEILVSNLHFIQIYANYYTADKRECLYSQQQPYLVSIHVALEILVIVA